MEASLSEDTADPDNPDDPDDTNNCTFSSWNGFTFRVANTLTQAYLAQSLKSTTSWVLNFQSMKIYHVPLGIIVINNADDIIDETADNDSDDDHDGDELNRAASPETEIRAKRSRKGQLAIVEPAGQSAMLYTPISCTTLQ